MHWFLPLQRPGAHELVEHLQQELKLPLWLRLESYDAP